MLHDGQPLPYYKVDSMKIAAWLNAVWSLMTNPKCIGSEQLPTDVEINPWDAALSVQLSGRGSEDTTELTSEDGKASSG